MNPDRIKQTLRRQLVDTRKKLPHAEQTFASASVCARVLSMEQYQQAKHIALYQAANGEIDLMHLTLLSHQTRYFPVINADYTLAFLPVTPETGFIKNRFGIAEPDVNRKLAIRPTQLDIIFLPLVAFDDRGTRLGMGAGYYDRTLVNNQTSLFIGAAYEFQRQPLIEREAWDVPLHAVITEHSTYWSKP